MADGAYKIFVGGLPQAGDLLDRLEGIQCTDQKHVKRELHLYLHQIQVSLLVSVQESLLYR